MEEMTVESLLQALQSSDPFVRRDAWLAAGKVGPTALPALARLAAEGELEVARAANRAMWQIVRYAGAPGREMVRGATVTALGEVMGGLSPQRARDVQLARDVLWMLSEIVQDWEIDQAIGISLLSNPELREDARMCLQRIGGENAVAVLKAGYTQAEGDFQAAVACSLRRLGQDVPTPPCPKLQPRKTTSVKPVGR
ncbi:HEAT repeat domain-containing protein [Thermopirellula anaerolimosa]